MIRFTGNRPDGGKVIGLALSRENCEKLLEGKPIAVNLQKDLNLNWQGEIVILAAETDQAVAELVDPLLADNAKVHVDDNPHQEQIASLGLGPTGDYPAGKISADDQGGTRIAIAADTKNNVVALQFGKPTTWIALPPNQALVLAQTLVKHARALAEAQTIIRPGNLIS